ncbi:hypothetical protein [Actinomadura hibisca]|uniref:hypothetical protein n=1 Tax=Actinomadura hibisca TaxID=68565 RepID=UPI0008321425|nr:hypothetical protein [Actinomadura hibisca]
MSEPMVADDRAEPEVLADSWRSPGGRAALSRARRAVRGRLRNWGLTAVADDVLAQLGGLVTAAAPAGLELRMRVVRPVRLLLCEVYGVGGEHAPSLIGVVAVTYGSRTRPGRPPTGFTHSFRFPCREG